MKPALGLFLAALLMFSLFGCAQQPAPMPEPAQTPEPTPEAASEPTPAPTPEATEESAVFVPDFRFSTTDRAGSAYDESVFAGHTLTMINFWEPWCGPCVREMPALEKLYQNYKDSGFLILGVYGTEGMEADVDAVLEYTGVSYPILHNTKDFAEFETGFVPTTVFVDGEGHVLRHTAAAEIVDLLLSKVDDADKLAAAVYLGGMNYDSWEAIVKEYLP